jgi:hypothetical protein
MKKHHKSPKLWTRDPPFMFHCTIFWRPTARVTRKWAGLDSVWERKKLKASKRLEKRAESHLSGARCVSRRVLVLFFSSLLT